MYWGSTHIILFNLPLCFIEEFGEIKRLSQGHIVKNGGDCVTPKLMFLITRLLAYSRHTGTTYTFKTVNIKL